MNTPTCAVPIVAIAVSLSLLASACSPEKTDEDILDGDMQQAQEDDTSDNNVKTADLNALEQALNLDVRPTPPQPIAELAGVHGRGRFQHEIVVEVYEVRVRSNSTFISWGIRSQEGAFKQVGITVSLSGDELDFDNRLPFQPQDNARSSNSSVRIVVPGDEAVYWPLQRLVGDGGSGSKERVGCMCSGTPQYITETPFIMNGIYPKIPDDVSTVSLRLPRFPQIDNIPVTRD